MINEIDVLKGSLEDKAILNDAGELIPTGGERFLLADDILIAMYQSQLELLTEILKNSDPTRMDIHNARTEVFKKWQDTLDRINGDEEEGYTCPMRATR